MGSPHGARVRGCATPRPQLPGRSTLGHLLRCAPPLISRPGAVCRFGRAATMALLRRARDQGPLTWQHIEVLGARFIYLCSTTPACEARSRHSMSRRESTQTTQGFRFEVSLRITLTMSPGPTSPLLLPFSTCPTCPTQSKQPQTTAPSLQTFQALPLRRNISQHHLPL